MKCVLAGDKAKALAKFLHFLSRIGGDLYIEAITEGLLLGTANSSNSGFARIHLWPSFFINYNVDPDNIASGDNCCRVAIKAFLPIFKSLKNVETCNISLNPGKGKLIIQLHCRQNTTKTHYISILEQETLTAPSRPQDTPVNSLTASQKVFTDILLIFNPNEEELTIEATRKSFSVKNYIESLHVNRQQMRTQLTLDPSEFDTYIVDEETTLTFCLKEWRAFLVLAESLSLNIAINFETTGHPIEFTISDLDIFDVTLFMSTLSSDLDSSRDVSGFVVPDASQVGPSGRNHKRTHEDHANDDLNVLLKRPKGREKRRPSQQASKVQYSNPDIEDYSNNDSASSTSNIRLTVARHNQADVLNVPTISNGGGNSNLLPRTQDRSNNVEIVFLRDSDDDSDRTLSNSVNGGFAYSTTPKDNSKSRLVVSEEVVEVPGSPREMESVQRRQNTISVFRRCYEHTLTNTDVTGLRNALADSSDEDN